MKKTIISSTILVAGITAATAATTFQVADGDLLDSANWSDGLPSASNVGTVSINAAWNTSNLPGWNLIIDGGTSAVATDVGPSGAGSSFTMNGGTMNVGDDIFVNNSSYTFNAGTVTWKDQFTPNGGGGLGVLTINGGTFSGDGSASIGSKQTGFTNILGGTFSNASLQFSNSAAVSSIGGSAEFTTVGTDDFNYVNFLSGWTGSINSSNFTTLAAWKTELTGGNNQFDGAALDSTTFDDNFVFQNGAIQAVPEPSSAALLGLGGLALILRRRK